MPRAARRSPRGKTARASSCWKPPRSTTAAATAATPAGLMRFVFNGVDDLAQIIPDLTEEEKKTHDFGTYTADHYYDDMGRITQYRTDPDLCEILITRSFETIVWMRKKGVKFQASYGRQSYKVDDGKRYKFWGGLAAETWGGGPGLVDNEHKACAREGIKIFYETPAIEPDHRRRGRRAAACAPGTRARTSRSASKAVVLACGGFESNAEMRARYLGPNWDLAKVRGTRYNTGLGIKMALDIGRHALRPLVGLPRGGLGPERAAVRRPRGRRQFPEAQLPVGHHGQCQRRALRRRRRGFPQLHLRQVRRGDPASSRTCSPGRFSTRRSSTRCATNTASSR